MATHTIPWATGSGNIILSYTGEGNETVTVESDTANEGVDRTQTLTFTDGEDLSVVRSVTQIGRRQPFNASDGGFLLSGGGQFLVLKS